MYWQRLADRYGLPVWMVQEITPSGEFTRFIKYWQQTEDDKWENPTPEHYYLAGLTKEVRDGFHLLCRLMASVSKKKIPPPKSTKLQDFLLSFNGPKTKAKWTEVKKESPPMVEHLRNVRAAEESEAKQNGKMKESAIFRSEEDELLEAKRQFLIYSYVLSNQRTKLKIKLPEHTKSFEAYKQWAKKRKSLSNTTSTLKK